MADKAKVQLQTSVHKPETTTFLRTLFSVRVAELKAVPSKCGMLFAENNRAGLIDYLDERGDRAAIGL